MAHQSADPFHLIASELDVAVSDLDSRISAWIHLLSHSSDYEAIEAEKLAIERSCQSLSSSLQKVAKSISVAEEHVEKYHLTPEDLEQRKQWLHKARAAHQKFVADTRSPQVLDLFRKRQSEALAQRSGARPGGVAAGAPSSAAMQDADAASGGAGGAGAAAGAPGEHSGGAFLADQYAQQDLIRGRQDEEIDDLRKGVRRLRLAGESIRDEVQSQNVMLDKLQGAAEEVQSRLSSARRAVDEVTKMAGKNGTLMIVVVLVVVLLIMIALLVLL